MPGIVGIISRGLAVERGTRLVGAMASAMAHEPFYRIRSYAAPEIGVYAAWVGHGRTGSTGADAAGTVDVIWCGESSECAMGRSESIDSVYARAGDRFVAELNGLFSGLLVDRQRRRAVLFNDRYGMERVYVHETPDATYFASEAKALLRVLPQLRMFDDDGIAEVLSFGCTLDWKTIFKGVRTLEGGSIWVFDESGCRKRRYFDPAAWEEQPRMSGERFREEFEALFANVLQRYVDARDDVGISLTAGLDTRMIMACLPSRTQRPVCYTFAGLGAATLDQRLAARVASACALEHRVLRLDTEFLSNFGDYVDRTVYLSDGCCGALAAHEIKLNAQARQLAPVRLTGNFGSEVLRGMSTFKPLPLSTTLVSEGFRDRLDAAQRNDVAQRRHPVTFAAFREIPWNLYGRLMVAKSQLSLRTPFLDNDLVALACRAPESEQQSTESALALIRNRRPDLTRIPTDRISMTGPRFARSLRTLWSAVMFKVDYLYNEGLPNWLGSLDVPLGMLTNIEMLGVHRYLPFRAWFRRELAAYVSQVLTDPSTARLPYWRKEGLPQIVADHTAGRCNYVREINAVLTINAAERLLLDSQQN